MLFNKGY
ncbi:uncharacterized protein FFE2_15976 [Fusarium fujikuroi]|nr:uncharacterized protein FFE2_15976 [Fusarium fujikuroi]